MPKDMDDLLYQHRVSDLWQRLAGCTWRDTQRLLEQERDLLTDLRWWPAVLKLLAPPATSFSHPTIEGLWIPQVPGIPTRATITVADIGRLAAEVYEVLSRLPPQRLGPSGAVNLLLAAPDADTFSQQAARLASHMDDAFFEALLTLAEEARWLGLESFAQQVEALRQLVASVLIQGAIAELASEAVRARTDGEAASRILRAARTAPRWLRSALEEMPGRAKEELPAAPVARALQRACEALEEGQDEATILANLENWLPLRQFLARHRLLLKAPFPMRPGEDWLARYGAKARAFLLQLGQAQDAQTLALYRLALAENEAEAEQAIAGEPHLLSAAGEQQARLQARSAQEQGQVTLASRLSAAAERIHAWLNELIRSERNAVVRLAEKVRSGELSLSEALAQVQQPETLRGISVLHVAALDEQINRLYQNGDLYQAELLASLSYAAARLLDNRKLRADLAISLAEIKSELVGRHAEALPLFEEAVQLAETLNEPFRLIRSVGPLGTVYEKLGRYNEARRYYERALTLARQAGLEGLEAAALGNLAGLHLLTGDLTSALRDSEQALAKARAAEDRYQIAQSLSTRALVLHRAARYDEAFFLCKEAAEEMRRRVEVEIFERRYVTEWRRVYRLASEAALRLNRPLEALEMLEQGRARWLAQQIALREAIPPTVPEELQARYDRAFQAVRFLRSVVYGEPGWGMRMIEEAQRGMQLLDKAQTEEEFKRMMAEAREREQQGYQQALANAEAELEQVTQEIRRYEPNFAAPLELPPLDWSRIADDPETAIVALFSGDQMACAVVLHPSGSHVVDLPSLQRAEVERLLYGLPQPLEQVYQEIEQQIAQSPEKRALAVMVKHYLTLRWIIEQAPSFQLGWQVAIRTLISEKTQAEVLARGREWMRQRGIPVEERETTLFDLDDARRLTMWQHLFDEMVAELKTRLWQPIMPLLRELGVSQVVLIPDADLHALPLAAGLPDEPELPAVAMAPSLRLYAQSIRWLREREPRENSLMLIANPTGDLSAAQVEAALLRDLFATHGEAAFVLSGKQATMQNVIRTSRVGNYWHFAGHAQYVWWNPAVSALWLAGKEPLPFYWIPMWLDLRAARLAVLSACETAITPTREALPEFTGLFSAFLLAGAPAVLASLWPVEEISTALLIYRFYQYHLGDSRESLAPRPPAVALRDAQQWLRTLRGEEALNHPAIAEFKRLNPPRRMWKQILALEDKSQDLPFANPYFWSGFMLVGV